MESWFVLLVVLGSFSVFIVERRLSALLRRFFILQRKIDLVLRHLGVVDTTSLSGGISMKVQEIASDPARKIEAIKVHREETGASLRDAKDAVETWMQENNVS